MRVRVKFITRVTIHWVFVRLLRRRWFRRSWMTGRSSRRRAEQWEWEKKRRWPNGKNINVHTFVHNDDKDLKQVSHDHCFMQDQLGMESATILVSKERAARVASARVVPLKEAVLEREIQHCARELERLGHCGQISLKSDQEPAIVDVPKEITNLPGSRGTLLEHSPVADSQSNGFVIFFDFASRIGSPICVHSPLFPWIVEHATDILNKCHVASDGKSTYERLKRRQHRGFSSHSGQRWCSELLGRFQEAMTERRHLGTWLGKRFRTEEHIARRRNDLGDQIEGSEGDAGRDDDGIFGGDQGLSVGLGVFERCAAWCSTSNTESGWTTLCACWRTPSAKEHEHFTRHSQEIRIHARLCKMQEIVAQQNFFFELSVEIRIVIISAGMVSLCSQFELKLRGVFWSETHVEKNTHQNVAVWKSQGFRSREQILNSCTDDEPPRNCCTWKTHQEFSVNHGNAVTNEWMNADVMMNELMNEFQPLRQKFSSQRGSGPSKSSAHRVSYLAASGGEWRRPFDQKGSFSGFNKRWKKEKNTIQI